VGEDGGERGSGGERRRTEGEGWGKTEERGRGVGEDRGEVGKDGGERRGGRVEGEEQSRKEKTQVIILSNNILTLALSPGCLPLRF